MILQWSIRRWLTLAAAFYVAAILSPIWCDWIPLASEGVSSAGSPLWGALTGFAVWAMVNGMQVGTFRTEPPSTTALAAWTIAAALLGTVVTVLLHVQIAARGTGGAMTLGNPAMLATMLALFVLFPSRRAGLMVPIGDECYRSNQRTAQTLTFRVAIAGLLALACWSYYAPLPASWPVVLSGLLTAVSVLYTGSLWRLEARDDT